MTDGCSAEAYAEAQGLNVNTLRWWKTELFGTRRGSKAPRASGGPFDLAQASRAPSGASAPLTVRLANELAKGALPAGELADRLGESYPTTLRELRELRNFGIVFRAGRGPGSTWVLG